jgi:hypothetical protein
VQQKPQRPFIPHRTPKASRPVTNHSDFRMGRPFVPGSFREVPEAAPITTVAPVAEGAPVRVAQRTDRDQLSPIEVFLDDEVFPGQDEEHEPPPVEHFLDPLPAVGSFAPDADGALMDESPVAADYASAPATGRLEREAGWGVDDWQQYDWRAAATLGEGVESQASNEWATTNWDTATPGARKKLSAAQAIANALDQIAQQIREGDLTIPSQSGAVTNPGAISAALAALLGVKR